MVPAPPSSGLEPGVPAPPSTGLVPSVPAPTTGLLEDVLLSLLRTFPIIPVREKLVWLESAGLDAATGDVFSCGFWPGTIEPIKLGSTSSYVQKIGEGGREGGREGKV